MRMWMWMAVVGVGAVIRVESRSHVPRPIDNSVTDASDSKHPAVTDGRKVFSAQTHVT